MSDSLTSLPQRVADLAGVLRLSAAAEERVRPEQTAQGLFDVLMEADLPADAIKVLPHLLRKRAAVWWGCLCAGADVTVRRDERHEAALGAAVEWVLDPCEETRLHASEVGKAAGGLTTSAGALALAAFWSEGSMSSPGLPAVPPPPHLTGSVVGGAVLLAAAEQAPGQPAQTQRQYLTLGVHVASGLLTWEDATPRVERTPRARTPRATLAEAPTCR